jgi:hypothetical protein
MGILVPLGEVIGGVCRRQRRRVSMSRGGSRRNVWLCDLKGGLYGGCDGYETWFMVFFEVSSFSF